MDFVPPFDQIGINPPGPWQNANPDLGIEGSIPNAVLFDIVQNEILNVQDEAGLTRNGADKTQLLQALRSGKLIAFADSGAADALVVTPRTAYTALTFGTEIAVLKGAAANATTTPTLSVSGLVRQIVKEDGTALAVGDLPASCLFRVTSDGTRFRVVGLRKSDTTPTIPVTALWHVGVDTSSSASTIVASVTPAMPTRVTDAAYLIVPANTCAGPTNVNFGFSPVTLVRNDGTALQANDYLAGQPLVIVDDGTFMRIVSLTVPQVLALVVGSSSLTNLVYNLSPAAFGMSRLRPVCSSSRTSASIPASRPSSPQGRSRTPASPSVAGPARCTTRRVAATRAAPSGSRWSTRRTARW